jgi:hypothetical protein
MGLSGMFSAIGGFGRRSLIGAGVGAGLGFMNTGDMGGVLGGAAAGAAFGGIGTNMLRNANYAGMIGKGSNAIVRGGAMAAGKLGMGVSRFSNPMVKKGFATASRGARAFTGAAMQARSFMGRRAIATNEWGGRAAVAAGMGSAAYIGSSVMSSNRGY